MEKETLRKIYLLKEIKPEKTWVSSVKKDILQNEDSVYTFPSLFARPGFALAGVVAILFMFVSLSPVSAPIYDGIYTATEREDDELTHFVEETESEITASFEEDFEVAVHEEPEKLSARVEDLSLSLREVQKQALEAYVLAYIADNELESTKRETLTEEEIANYLIQDMGRMFTGYNDSEKELFVEAQDSFENQDFTKVLDIFLQLK